MVDNKNKIIVVLVALIAVLLMLGRCNKPIDNEPDVTIVETIKTDTIYITKPPVVITEYVRVNKREQVFINNTDTIHTFSDCDVDSIIIKGEDKIIENTITIEKTIRDRQLHHLMLGGDVNTRLDIGLEVLYVYNKVGIKVGIDYLPMDNKFAPKVGLVWKIK